MSGGGSGSGAGAVARDLLGLNNLPGKGPQAKRKDTTPKSRNTLKPVAKPSTPPPGRDSTPASRSDDREFTPGADARSKWSTDLLHALGYPVTASNVAFLNAWQLGEGTRARFNPLATTQPWSGAGKFNSVGVRNYSSYEDGLAATVKTLRNGRYTEILAALKSGNGTHAAVSSQLNTWGTGSTLVQRILSAGG